MGNILAARQAPIQTDLLLYDDLNLTSQGVLGGGRFLTTMHCITENGHLVVKLYYKRGEREGDLSQYEAELKRIKQIIGNPNEFYNLMPFAFYHEAPRAAYIVRQYCASTIEERTVTPPGLTLVEKQWFAYQMLNALSQCHSHDVCHGDVTLGNFIVTSFRWAYLTDFASYKPVYLPSDDPSRFEYFFDSGEHTKRCYIAPERFYDATSKDKDELVDGHLTPEMDIFSVGCSIAEMYLGGEIVLTYQESLAYRRGEFDITPRLARIEDERMREIVAHMMSRDPSARWTSGQYMERYGFPSAFMTMHTITLHANNMAPDMRLRSVADYLGRLLSEMYEDQERGLIGKRKPMENYSLPATAPAAQSSPSHTSSQPVTDFHSTTPTTAPPQSSGHTNTINNNTTTTHNYPVRSRVGGLPTSTSATSLTASSSATTAARRVPPTLGRVATEPNLASGIGGDYNMGGGSASQQLLARIESVHFRLKHKAPPPTTAATTNSFAGDGTNGANSTDDDDDDSITQDQLEKKPVEGVILVATVIFASMRHLNWPSSRILALDLLLELSWWTDDLVRVQRMVPYVKCLIGDPAAQVRARAIEVLTQVMSQVQTLTKGEATVFDEYIFPDLASKMKQEKDELVLVSCANCIATLAELSLRFLNLASTTIAPSASAMVQEAIPSDEAEDSSIYDERLHQLRVTVWGLFDHLFHCDHSSVRRCLYAHLTQLCCFFGWSVSLNNVLPVIVSPLNSFADWQLRAAFFENIPGLCLFLGRECTENHILPCVFEKLMDPEELVVQRAVGCLVSMSELHLLSKTTMVLIAENTAPLVCHPNNWIRYSTIVLLSTIGRQLDPVDVFTFVVRYLDKFLLNRITHVDEETLLSNLRPPLSRPSFDRAVQTGPDSFQNLAIQISDRTLLEADALGVYLEKAHYVMDSFQTDSHEQVTKQFEKRKEQQTIIDGLKRYIIQFREASKRPLRKGDEAWHSMALETALQLQNPSTSATEQVSDPRFALSPALLTPLQPSNIDLVTSENSASDHHVTEPSESPQEKNTPPDETEASRSTSSLRPRGLLMAQLMDHTRAVTRLCVSYQHAYFASCSDDGTVKLWSPSQIAKHYTNRAPTLTHSLGSPITAMALSPTSQAIACASQSGLVQMFDVEIATVPAPATTSVNFTGPTDTTAQRFTIKTSVDVSTEGCVLAMSFMSSGLLSVTHQNIMKCWDTRSRREAFEVPSCPPLHMGIVQDMLVDQQNHWVLLGTSLGFLVVYDLRFQVVSKAWRHPKRCPIVRLQHFKPVNGQVTPQSGPLVLVAAMGPPDECCSVWDIGSGVCHSSFQVLNEATVTPKEPLRLVDCDVFVSGPVNFWKNPYPYQHLSDETDDVSPNDRQPFAHYTRAMCHPLGAPFVITGGTDRTVRLWDLSKPRESYRIVAPLPKFSPAVSGVRTRQRPPQFAVQNMKNTSVYIEHPLPDNTFVVEDLVSNLANRAPGLAEGGVSMAHRGAITDVAIIKHTDHSRLLLTSGRDGVIKVFK